MTKWKLLRSNDDEDVYVGDYHNDCNYDGDVDDVNEHYDANVDDDEDDDDYDGIWIWILMNPAPIHQHSMSFSAVRGTGLLCLR